MHAFPGTDAMLKGANTSDPHCRIPHAGWKNHPQSRGSTAQTLKEGWLFYADDGGRGVSPPPPPAILGGRASE